MNRLESIKERYGNGFYTKSTPLWGKDESGNGDVDYLLQRLEKYETALKELTTAERDHTLLSVERIAKEALKDEAHT